MARNVAKKVAIGAAFAAAAGYLAGILTAPKSGKETREDIKNKAEKTVSGAEAQLNKLKSELDELVATAKSKGSELGDKARGELDDLVKNAQEAKDKMSGIITAVRKDDSADKDLKKAVADATKAIDHLRKYLAK